MPTLLELSADLASGRTTSVELVEQCLARTQDDDDEYARTNLLILRNPSVINFLDGCAASVPIHAGGEPPARLMVAGLAGEDAQVLRIAAWIEERT